MSIKLPKDFVIAVTYNCNSKCRMCNIWKSEPMPGLDLAEIAKLPDNMTDVNLSGGEPFLRSDLPEVVRLLAKKNPRVRIIISSNGFATDLILKQMSIIKEIMPDIGIGISIDGIGKLHDEIRGIPGGYKKVLATIKGLQELGIKNIRVAFTAGDYNITDLYKVYKLSKKLNVEFTIAAVHNAENYFNIAENKITKMPQFKREFEKLIKSELASWNIKKWFRAYFAYALYQYVFTGKRCLPNYSGQDSVFIDPQATVYPADVSAHKMGNLIKFKSFEHLFYSPKSQKSIKLESVNQNWMICTARSAMKRHSVQVIFWIIKNKLWGIKL